jgi:hypothetical protein
MLKSSDRISLRFIHRNTRPGFALLLSVLFVASCHSKQGQNSSMSEEQGLREKIASLARQEQILNADVSLSKTPAPYISLDYANRKIELKTLGHSLRSFSIARIQRTGGSPSVAEVWNETEAKPLQVPTRAQVVPGSGEATTASTATHAPWGPQRMPGDFDLICKGDQVLEIRSLPSTQSSNRFSRWIVGGYRRARDWAREVVGRRNSNYREKIEIWMSEDDAKLLFWSLPKQFGILLLNVS